MAKTHNRRHADNVTAAGNSAQSATINCDHYTPIPSPRQHLALLFRRAWWLAEVDPEARRQPRRHRLAAWFFDVIAAREVCP